MRLVAVVIFAVILTAAICSATTAPITEHEFTALHDIYLATNGDDWIIGDGTLWNFDTSDNSTENPCADPVWYGLTCVSPNGSSFSYVTQINLAESNLDGTIPLSIGNFSKLESLILESNYLYGGIPTQLCNLTTLINLIMDYNDLSGPLLPELSFLTELAEFGFYENQLTGTISPQFSKLTRLFTLLLSGNYLTSTIPSGLGDLTSINELYLDSNLLSGELPTSLTQLSNLEYFTAYSNLLDGTIPSQIGNLQALLLLDIGYNYLTGRIPLTLYNCSYLYSVQVNINQFTGTIAAEIGQLSNLQILQLNNNKLVGTLPSAIWHMTALTLATFQENQLTGTIPPELCELKNLQLIYLYSNLLTGSIPATIGNLSSLLDIYAFDNFFTGSLPPEFGDIVGLVNFGMSTNLFNGTLPASMGNCTQLQYIAVNDNLLSGSIPPEFGNLTQMQYFDAFDNFLSGSLPAELGAWCEISQLMLYSNRLTGSIPESYGNMTRLNQLYLYDNQLTGTLSPTLFDLPQLNGFYIYSNFLSGSLPENIGNLSSLVYLVFEENSLTGTIPSSIGNLSNLAFMGLTVNYLSGTLPNTLNKLQSMFEIAVYDNVMTGTLPANLGQIPALAALLLYQNYFTGTLPSEFGGMSGMESCGIGDNLLSGTIPSELSQWTQLQTMSLEDNLLSGSLTSVFNASIQRGVLYVGLAYNQFTGSIPVELFKISSLIQFEIVSACMSGAIPVDICGAQNMTTLLLDGITTGSSCQRKIFPHVHSSTAYTATKRVSGSIPACLFNMSALQTLHLSGNSISGSLPADLEVGSALTQLILSHNQISGTIPLAIQQHAWSTLDLSFNKLSGVLVESYASVGTNASVSLEVNCLSGDIPTALREAQSVNLVNGNMFACGVADRSALPAHDSASDNYQCGSNSLNLSMYLFCACAAMFTIVLAFIVLRRQQIMQESDVEISKNRLDDSLIARYHMWVTTAAQIDENSNLGRLISVLTHYRRSVLIASAVILVFLLPAYSVMSVFFSTYTHAYAWTTSAAFLAGETPGIVLFVLWMLIVLVLIGVDWWLCGEKEQEEDRTVPSHAQAIQQETITWRSETTVAVVLVINVIAVVGMNVFYVWVVLNADSQAGITFTEVLLASFKLIWNDAVIPRLFQLSQAGDFRHYTALRVCILLFNNIVAPCAATATISPDCFYYVVTNERLVSAATSIRVCEAMTLSTNEVSCQVYMQQPVTYSYLPPYIYSYQCGANLISNYASIFVYMFLIDAFVKPLYLLTLSYMYTHWHSALPLTEVLVPNILKAPQSSHLNMPNRPLLNRDTIVLNVVNTCAILLTFGVVFPLLSAVICVNVLMSTRIIQLSVGRVLTLAGEDSVLLSQYLGVMQKECAEVGAHISRSLWLVVPVVAVFYSIFVFDTFGFTGGWRLGVWASAAMILPPLVTKVAEIVWRCVKKRREQKHKQHTSDLTSSKQGGSMNRSEFSHRQPSVVEMSGGGVQIMQKNPIRASEF